jgi:hypothetical protein
MVICGTCGATNHDPGGDLRLYSCGQCGQPTLQRVQYSPNNNAFAGAVVGGTLGGVAGGPVGALFGIFIGGLLGNQVK